jgi:GTPase SAR1 family protein
MDITSEYLEELQNEEDKERINEILPKVESWVTLDNKSFFFSFKCIETIPSGLYSMTYNDGQGFGVTKMDYKSEDFLHLPSLPHKQIISDLQKFWDNKQKFIDYNLNPKRGIILHGDPGCGKTSLIYLLVEEIKKRNGISIYFDIPENWVEIAKLVRKVEKERPILCIIEDIDLVIAKHGEEIFLNFLDGLNSITNVVYVATTNNIEKIPDRIKDRPSRFDKKYQIKKPTEQDRKLYFETKLLEKDKKKYDLKKLVKDTHNFTMAHMKEVFISLYILDNPYDEVIGRLKSSKITDNTIGFNLNEDYD